MFRLIIIFLLGFSFVATQRQYAPQVAESVCEKEVQMTFADAIKAKLQYAARNIRCYTECVLTNNEVVINPGMHTLRTPQQGSPASICEKETNFTYAEAMKGKNESVIQELKCYFKCLLTKSKLIHDDDSIDFKKLAQLLSRTHSTDKVDKIIGICQQTVGADSCDLAYKIWTCVTTEERKA